MRFDAIETDRLVLREWRYSDSEPFAAMNADAEVMRYFPNPLSRKASDAFIRRIMDEIRMKGYGLFAVALKSTGEFIGYVGLHEITFDSDIKGETEIGWRIDKRYWGRGYATEAATAVLDFARAAGLRRIYSFTAAINTPSERLMQRLNMTKLGEFDHPALSEGERLRRHVLYGIDLSSHPRRKKSVQHSNLEL